jgi:splicing factor 45
VWTGSSYCATVASLRFQPPKRPQIAAQKAKARAIASKFAIPPPPSEVQPAVPNQPAAPQPAPAKTTIADWTTTASDDENVTELFGGEKRPRGGRKKRKKNRATEELVQNWDDVYDPSRPNNYEDYKNSEEKIREVREWKDRLYAHRARRRSPTDYSSDESHEARRHEKNSMIDSADSRDSTLTIHTRAICTSIFNVICASGEYQR